MTSRRLTTLECADKTFTSNMTLPPANLTVAYLARGKIRIKTGAAAPRTVDSVCGSDIREKAVRAQ